MRILVAANHVPFLHGGAELHVQGLVMALQQAGHVVETLRLPFCFNPEADVHRAMDHAASLDMTQPNGQRVDRLISLQFPAWGIRHPDHWTWVMHQHRAVYELAGQQLDTPAFHALQQAVRTFDHHHLHGVRARFANSARVAERLQQFNGLTAQVLHHPPPAAEGLHAREPQPYLFFPSRLESLKRQQLVIAAAARMRSPLKLILAGEGGQQAMLQHQIDTLGLHDRVRLIGRVTLSELHAFYASALAVVYPPYDEDYGYVTLEAMLSSRPVVTCHDSGGPLAFVQHDHNGWIESAEPEALAARFDWLYAHPARVAAAGRAALNTMQSAKLSWQTVVETLTATHPPAPDGVA